MHIYSIEEYVAIGISQHSIHLEKLFNNLEFLAQIYIPRYNDVEAAIKDPEGYGKVYLSEQKKTLDDLRLDMENLGTAIMIVRGMKK